MRKKILLYFPLIILTLLCSFESTAQSDVEWAPVKLDVAGRNIVKEVEGAFKKTTCNDEDVILIKFTNRNKYPVTIKWYDAVLKKNNVWVKKDDSTAKKVLTISPSNNVEGACEDGTVECIIKLKDYIDIISDYQLYAIYKFEVVEEKK